MAACAAHTTNKKYSSPNRSKNPNKSHTTEPTFQTKKVYGKTGQENGPKAERNKTERATGLRVRIRTREEI